MTTCSYSQILSTAPQWCLSNSKGTKRDILTQNKDMNLRLPLIHPQLQVSCAFAWCIAARVLRFLKPSLNYHLACSLNRNIWIRFYDMLIMLNNGFHKIDNRWGTLGHSVNWLIIWKPLNSLLWKHINVKKEIMPIPKSIP